MSNGISTPPPNNPNQNPKPRRSRSRWWLFLLLGLVIFIPIAYFATAYIHKSIIISRLTENMVSVEGGTFTMGADEHHADGASSNEFPPHKVTLSDFKIGKYEVTEAEWYAAYYDGLEDPFTLIDNLFSNYDKYPVTHVSWEDCQKFIRNLNKRTGKDFRLPTEAEWEFAARGGNYSHNYLFSGSDNIRDVAYFDGNSAGTPHPIGSKEPNELGLYDMSGNVSEWCYDRYGTYEASDQTNPFGPNYPDSLRVIRGGNYNRVSRVCRVTSRGYIDYSEYSERWGLRLAL